MATDPPDTDPSELTLAQRMQELRELVTRLARDCQARDAEHDRRISMLESDMRSLALSLAKVTTTLDEWRLNIQRFYDTTWPTIENRLGGIDRIEAELAELRRQEREASRDIAQARLESQEARLRPAKAGAVAGAGGAALVEIAKAVAEWLHR